MRVFITGATGYIGGAVAKKLIESGHEVIGLARSDASARRLEAMGATVHRGDLNDTASLQRGAAAAEGVIHAGFNHDDWQHMDAAFSQDQAAVGAMLTALASTNRPFIYTSGTGVLADTGTKAVDETEPAKGQGVVALRADLEQTIIEAAQSGVRTVVMRPGLVYGRSGGGVLNMMFDLARQSGSSRTVGDGHNVWSAVHIDDLADAYLKALERAPAGSLFNIGTNEIATMHDVGSAIGRALKLEGAPTVWPVDEARNSLGPLADGLASNKRISSERARNLLGWQPAGPSLINEIEHGSYATPSPAKTEG